MALRRRSKVVIASALVALFGLAGGVADMQVASAGTGTISGSVFEDLDRNGGRDPGEPGWGGKQLYLFNGAGDTYLGTVLTDATGAFRFGGLADGDYRVDLESGSWSTIRMDWVPTTTGGSLYPQVQVRLTGQATADLGWRPIRRSTDLAAPISEYRGPSGVSVASYNDAVTAQQVHAVLAGGALIGAEAGSVSVRIGYSETTSTSGGASSSSGVYTTYSAASYISYAAWLDTPDFSLFHEYGHAWSMYHAFLAQQDPSLSGYLQARNLTNDARVNTSYGWSARELIAEDYRQLFGTAQAAVLPQANSEIPPAGAVAGLREYLATTFMAPVTGSPPPDPAPLSLADLAVSPAPVKTTGVVTFSLSAPATVTARVVDSKGNLVKTLLDAAPRSAGSVSVTWDRTNASGRKVRAGTYTVRVDATDAAGTSAASAKTFSVS